jgi:hypothetical protein
MADHIRTIDRILQANPINMRALLRLATWGGAAAAALMLAVLSAGLGSKGIGPNDMGPKDLGSKDLGSKDLGSKGVTIASPAGVDLPRVPTATVQIAPKIAPLPTEAEKATRQLSEAVSGLTADRDRLVARIASIERNLEDVTGSIKQQQQQHQTAAASAPASPDPAALPAIAPASVATSPAPPRRQSQPEAAPPQAAKAAPPGAIAPPPSPAARVANVAAVQEPEPAKSAEPAKSRIVDFAIDIGGATTFEGLRALWNSVKGATADLFDDLHPMVAARENKARGVDLRLIVGPIASTEAATQMCATLLAARRYCQMTIFEGQPLPQTGPMAEPERRPVAPTRTTSSSSGQTKSVRPPAPPRP